jgi:hypothetical protein
VSEVTLSPKTPAFFVGITPEKKARLIPAGQKVLEAAKVSLSTSAKLAGLVLVL